MIAAFGQVAYTEPSLNYAALAPLLVIFGGAVLGVLVEAFVPRDKRYTVQVGLTVLALLGAMGGLALAFNHQGPTAGLIGLGQVVSKGSVVVDGPTLFLWFTILVFALISVLSFAERLGGVGAEAFTPMGSATPGSPQEGQALRLGKMTSEVFPLFLFAVGGMMLFPAAGDLLIMFVALEVLSLPLYIMTGLARRRRLLSQEASLKYFLLGSFASAFFLFGIALLYGFSGSLYLSDLAEAIASRGSVLDGLLVPGVLLLLVGLLFKVGAAPFHMWTPDVYQGAPTPVTGFMAAATKAAAFGAILRVAYVGIDRAAWEWRPAVMVIAAITMVVGAVLSVTQRDMKRLLAYSSIAHAGFILVGVTAMSKQAVGGTLFYLLTYGLATIAAFGIVGLVRQGGSEASHLSQWSGLGRRHPVTAAVFAFLLLAFAGIPLTSGFAAKFAVFAPAISSGPWGTALVVLGLICSAITVFVYARVIVLMYFDEGDTAEVGVVDPSWMSLVTIGVGAILTLVLGVAPSLVMEFAERSALFIR